MFQTTSNKQMFTDYFSSPASAISQLCVFVQ